MPTMQTWIKVSAMKHSASFRPCHAGSPVHSTEKMSTSNTAYQLISSYVNLTNTTTKKKRGFGRAFFIINLSFFERTAHRSSPPRIARLAPVSHQYHPV